MYTEQYPLFRFCGSISLGDDNALFLSISMVTGFRRINQQHFEFYCTEYGSKQNKQHRVAQCLMAFEESWPQDCRTKHILFFSACLGGLTS